MPELGFTFGGSTGATYGGATGGTLGADTPHAVQSLTVTQGSAEGELDLSWTPNGTATEYIIYRATASGSATSDYTQVTTVSAPTTSYTDTGLLDGEQYYYRVSARNTYGESGLSPEASAVTLLPAATSVSVSNVTADAADVSWTDNANNEDGYRVLLSRDGGSTWTNASGDLAADTTSYSLSGLLNGEEYTVTVEVFTEHTATRDATQPAFTTDLPDVGQPTLGNDVEDEVSVDWTDAINYGDYRLQIEETDTGSDWSSTDKGYAEHVVGEATTSDIFGSREDGEEYRVRMRTETEHVTGAWTDPVTIGTKFPGATNLTVEAVGQTSVDLSWTDNSDNEDGFRLQYRKLYDDGSVSAWRTATTVAPNTTSSTIDTLQPGCDYEFRVVAYTEHATGASNVVSATTTSVTVRQRRVPSSGWYVEVEHPQRDEPLTPRILDDPEISQQVNGLPTLRIPVPKDDIWQREAFTEQAMRVWKDGRRQPVEQLQRVELAPDRTVLEAVGGVELERGIQTQVDQQPVDEFVREQVGAVTSYALSVDDPAATVTGDVLFQSTEYNSFAELIADALGATEPIGVVAGALQPLRSSWMATVGNEELEGGYTAVSDFGESAPHYIDGEAARASGATILSAFTADGGPRYTIPSDRVGIAHHNESVTGSGDIGDLLLEVVVDGERYVVDDVASGTGWTTYEDWGAPEIPPDVPVSIEYSIADTFEVDCDALVLYDTKYRPEFPAVESSLEPLAHPSPYQPITVTTITSTQDRSVTGGELVLDIDDTSGAQAVALSNDDGASWATASNTASITHDFADPELGPSLQARLTLDGYGSRGTSPATDYLPQRVASYTLSADLDDTPLVLDQVYDQSLLSVLTDLADYADALFEVRWDADAERLSLEWTQPGQRDPQDARRLSDWSAAKTTADRPDVIRVEGSAIDETDEVLATLGERSGLAEYNLVSGSEEVRAADTDTVYERHVDYEIDWIDGSVTPLSSGAISEGETLTVRYRYKPAYEAPVGSADEGSGQRKQTIQLPGLVTERGCGIAARRIASQLDEPLREATVTLPSDEGWSLVNAIDPEGVPTDGPLTVQSIETEAGETVLTLGSRGSLGEIVADIQAKLSKTAKRS